MIILAVDPGATSGYAVIDASRSWRGVIRSGIATDHASRVAAIVGAAEEAQRLGACWRIVAETWSRHGRWSVAAQTGVAAQWGRWQAAIDEAERAAPSLFARRVGRRRAYRGVIRVDPQTWYPAVIGARSDPRPQRLARVMATAMAHGYAPITHDEACAIAIGVWAAGQEAA